MSRIVLLTIGCCLCSSAARGDAPDCSDARSPQTSIETAEQLFEQWLAHRPEPEAFTAKCATRKYDFAFGVERLSTISLQWHSPDRWEVRIEPVKITDAMKSARDKPGAKVRRRQDGTPYYLESDEHDTLSRESNVMVLGHDGEQVTFEVEPSEAHPTESPHSWLSRLVPTEAVDLSAFLFFQPNEVQERCVVTSLQPVVTSENSETIRFTVKPRSAKDSKQWKRADVVLDTQTWTPLHVRVVYPSDSGEEVYSFRSYQPLGSSEAKGDNTKPSLDEPPGVAK